MADLAQRRMDDLRATLGGFVVVPYSAAAVEAWARLHATLSGQLHRGGTNDLWTAALAQSPPLPVVTNNLNDFTPIATAHRELQLIHPDLDL